MTLPPVEPTGQPDAASAAPEATPDAEGGEQQAGSDPPAPESTPATPETDPYLKQLSQQQATLANQVGELVTKLDNLQAPSTQAQADADADAQALQETKDDLGGVLEELSSLEQALEDRDELEGVEPADLKATIKAMGSIVKRINGIEQRVAESQQATEAVAQESSAEAFFKAESQTHGIDAKEIWTKASEEAVKYVGDHEPGTPGHELARNFAQTRYGELVQAAKAQASTQAPATPAPTPSAPVTPTAPAPAAATQPRHDPTGSVTHPAGARPAAPDGKRDTNAIIGGLITP